MITGNATRKIKEYYFIDRLGEGLGAVTPKDNEEIIGVPYQWCSDNSYPFIEHLENGVITKTVNVLDISYIVFV